MVHDLVPKSDDELVCQIIGAAIEVHRILGPGFLESIYETAMKHELDLRGIQVEQQRIISIQYKGLDISGQRLDLLVGIRVIVELKCVDEFAPIHKAQLISYLKATRLRVGLLLNFKALLLKDGGIKRIAL